MLTGDAAESVPVRDDWARRPDVDSAIDQLEDASPRLASVLAGALLDDLLERILSKVVPSEEPASLRHGEIDYSQKALWSLRFGLIDQEEHRELRLVGRIRNEFAHNWSTELDFDCPRIRNWVDALRTPDAPLLEVKGAGRYVAASEGIDDYIKKGRHERFLTAINQLLVRLVTRLDVAIPVNAAKRIDDVIADMN